MSLLPYLGESEATKDWTEVEKWSFAIFTYLMISLYLITLGIAVHNFVKFVVI